MKGPTFDREKVHFNVARLKKEGRTFEVVIDPDLAIQFKKEGGDVREVLHAQKIFCDAHKGLPSPDDDMEAAFQTTDTLAIAARIIKDGQIQLTSEYREKKREEKKKRILELIRINAIDARTGLPHPLVRLENAFAEARVKIDEDKSAEDQVNDIITQLRPVLPLKIDVKKIQVHIPANYAAKMYGTVKSFGRIIKEDWLNDGSWRVVVEIPAGLQTDFYEDLNGKTHGNCETKLIE
ncbi:MAG: ribosome assembly factor SBDS [Nanoarchaeota archaeon]